MFRHRIRLTVVGTALITALSVCGAPVTPEAALGRIEAEAPQYKPGKIAAKMLLVHTHSSDAVPMVYVFAGGDGFAVAPADDAAPALLGYGTSFDPDNIPDNMRWWLDEYAQQIEWLQTHKLTVHKATGQDHERIYPLVTTLWNQRYPYNLLCPEDEGGKTYAGCVATAIAQIVNYHQWPQGPGIGTHSYLWNDRELSFDYGATTFDWANMADTYSQDSPANQCDAVAKLMYACGVGVNMKYTSEESGATPRRIPTFLREKLGYDIGTEYIGREYASAEEWDSMMYGELAAGRPILYGGASERGGHAFVCDGYDCDGFYHINWGWGGNADGYFLLSILDPRENGSGYNQRQNAVIGIQCPTSGTTRKIPLLAKWGFKWYPEYSTFGFKGAYLNYTPEDIVLMLGIRIVDQTETETYVKGHSRFIPGMDENDNCWGDRYINLIFPVHYPAGTYKVYPVARFMDSDEWQLIRVREGQDKFVTVRKASNGAMTYDGADPAGITSPLKFYDFHQVGQWKSGEIFSLECKVSNSQPSNFDAKFGFCIYKPGTDIASNCLWWDYTFEGNTDSYYKWKSSDPLTLPDGEYLMRAFDHNGVYLSDPVTVYVGEPSALGTIEAEGDGPVDVYNLQGMPVRKGVIADEATQGLPTGIYIVNGKKILVK